MIEKMTPSAWHDDARNRDAGHDEMQLSWFRYIRSLKREPFKRGHSDEYHRIDVVAEAPFIKQGRIIAFADVCEIYQTYGNQHGQYKHTHYLVYEIKPRIHSVGAVIRQCEALRNNIKQTSDSYVTCEVSPVVPFDDPKLDMLVEMYRGFVLTLKKDA